MKKRSEVPPGQRRRRQQRAKTTSRVATRVRRCRVCDTRALCGLLRRELAGGMFPRSKRFASPKSDTPGPGYYDAPAAIAAGAPAYPFGKSKRFLSSPPPRAARLSMVPSSTKTIKCIQHRARSSSAHRLSAHGTLPGIPDIFHEVVELRSALSDLEERHYQECTKPKRLGASPASFDNGFVLDKFAAYESVIGKQTEQYHDLVGQLRRATAERDTLRVRLAESQHEHQSTKESLLGTVDALTAQLREAYDDLASLQAHCTRTEALARSRTSGHVNSTWTSAPDVSWWTEQVETVLACLASDATVNRDLQAALAITTAQKTDLFDQFNLLFEQDCASQAQINDLKSQVASLQFTLSAEHEMLEEKAVQIRSLERALETSASEVQDMVATSAHEKVALEQHIDRIADEKNRLARYFLTCLRLCEDMQGDLLSARDDLQCATGLLVATELNANVSPVRVSDSEFRSSKHDSHETMLAMVNWALPHQYCLEAAMRSQAVRNVQLEDDLRLLSSQCLLKLSYDIALADRSHYDRERSCLRSRIELMGLFAHDALDIIEVLQGEVQSTRSDLQSALALASQAHQEELPSGTTPALSTSEADRFRDSSFFYQQSLDASVEKCSMLVARNRSLEGELDALLRNLDDERVRARAAISEAHSARDTFEKNLELAHADLTTVRAELAELRDRLMAADSAMSCAFQDNAALKTWLDTLLCVCAGLQDELFHTRNDLVCASEMLSAVPADSYRSPECGTDVNGSEACERLLQVVSYCVNQGFHLRDDLEHAVNSNEVAIRDLDAANDNCQTLRQQLEQAEQSHAQLRDRIADARSNAQQLVEMVTVLSSVKRCYHDDLVALQRQFQALQSTSDQDAMSSARDQCKLYDSMRVVDLDTTRKLSAVVTVPVVPTWVKSKLTLTEREALEATRRAISSEKGLAALVGHGNLAQRIRFHEKLRSQNESLLFENRDLRRRLGRLKAAEELRQRGLLDASVGGKRRRTESISIVG
ncbi:unnamed protein product (mitochondrion) [Plasmodiophora brassicae]|uniref:Uncharacterized protein n=1 Tax=Plasmodiophora brassicae TaxID=37360 RepID=A0A3P3YI40_PLABS|nr:unnamed protein product [Plasmodiophora brassicae]